MTRSKQLAKIWRQVPPDYYQKGINNNIFQRFWHNQKLATFTQLAGGKTYKTILEAGFRMANRYFSHFGMEVTFVLNK